MRKHLYLITDHPEDEDMVGMVKIKGSRIEDARKNEDRPIRVMNFDTGESYRVGHVSLGYVDFEDEAEYEDQIDEAIKRKLAEVDEAHLEKAGVEWRPNKAEA